MPDTTGYLMLLSLLCVAPLLGVISAWRIPSNGGLDIKKIVTQRQRYRLLGVCLAITSLMTLSLHLLAPPSAVVLSAYELLDRGALHKWAAVHGMMLLWGAWEGVILVAVLYVRLRPAPMARRSKDDKSTFTTTKSARQKQATTVKAEICMAAVGDEPELSRRLIFTEIGSGKKAYWYDRAGREHNVTRTVK